MEADVRRAFTEIPATPEARCLAFGDVSVDGAGLSLSFLPEERLAQRGGNREQEDKADAHSRKQRPSAAQMVNAGNDGFFRPGKQHWTD